RRIDQWNDFVRIEIASALKQNKLVIPVLVGGTKMPAPKDLPEDLQALARRNAIVLSHQRFGSDVAQFINTLKISSPAKTAIKARSNSEVVQRKAEALKAVRADLVGATDSPLYHYRNDNRHFPVLGEGNPD